MPCLVAVNARIGSLPISADSGPVLYLDWANWQSYTIASADALGHNDSDPEFNAFIDWVVFNAGGLNYASVGDLESDLTAGDQLTQSAFDAAAAAYTP